MNDNNVNIKTNKCKITMENNFELKRVRQKKD